MKFDSHLGLTVASCAAVGIICTVAGTASANLVTNGDFSANASSYGTYPGYSIPSQTPANPANPTDWTATNQVDVNGPDTGFYATYGSPFAPSSASGVRDFVFLQNASLNAPASIEQTFSTTAGQLYTLSYVAAQRSFNSNATMEALILNAANGSTPITTQTPSINNNSFTSFTLSFTAESSTTAVEFLNTTPITYTNGAYSDNTVDVSNVVVDAVPLPATLGLIGFGSLALGLLLLKRRTGGSVCV